MKNYNNFHRSYSYFLSFFLLPVIKYKKKLIERVQKSKEWIDDNFFDTFSCLTTFFEDHV